MTINVKSVTDRRELSFTSLDDVVADAERLVATEHIHVMGNWPLPRLIEHLALTIDQSIDGFPTRAPLFVRLIAPFLKSSMMKKMSPGIKLPKSAEAGAFPDTSSAATALEHLRSAVARTRTNKMLAPHPAFGKMTHEEWNQLHLRHSELHLSFVKV